MQTYTVSQVTLHIKDLLEGDSLLPDLWVEGEVSNYVRSSAGHMYFTLKDAQAQLPCVLWRSRVSHLEHVPTDGEAAIVHGHISVYQVRGVYQLYVDQMRRAGTGDLFLQFQMLKEKLRQEGLFAKERKRALPPFPRRVGVVTSPTGAALRDILHVLQRRYPLAEIILAPTLVQGDGASPQIVAAIEALNLHTDVDVIIVARGGGSLEELWAFNDERVARAIVASITPIISGVGHETDSTISDFVADVRAPTPSAAAEIAVPDQEALRAHLLQARDGLALVIGRCITEGRTRTEYALGLLRRASPRVLVDRWRQSLDDMRERMTTVHRHRSALLREHVSSMKLRLQTLSPQETLERGYAIVSRSDTGSVVTQTAQVTSGDAINVRVSDGRFTGVVD
ncbi:MAG: exodeoxyribonuclease VII large subunit [Candidatus Thorarchaeota archaeon]